MHLAQGRAIRNSLGVLLGLVFGLAVTAPITVAALKALPVVSILSPAQDQLVTGSVRFWAQSDSSGVTSLQFQVDGSNAGAPITAGSCGVTWDSTRTGDGRHTVQGVVVDQYGNTLMTQPVTFLVSNATAAPTPAPSPSPSPSPTPSPGPTPAPSPTPEPSPSPSPRLPAPEPSPVPTPSPTPDPAPAPRVRPKPGPARPKPGKRPLPKNVLAWESMISLLLLRHP